MTPIERYPLTWPVGWIRTPEIKRQQARFEVAFTVARDHLLEELRRLGALDAIISSNIPVRQDGLPYARYRQPDDPGVAVYFQLNKKPHVLACDRWLDVKDNLRAIGLHIEATRGIARWGVGSLEQAFSGYQALPASSNGKPKDWWVVLGVAPDAPATEIRAAYKELVRRHHPDTGGSNARMLELNWAYDMAKARHL